MKNNSSCGWPSMQVRRRANGQVAPCCKFVNSEDRDGMWLKPQRDGTTLSALFSSASFGDLRHRLERGESTKACDSCYRMEASGAKSMRLKSYGNKLSAGLGEKPSLRSLELELGNLCNLNCRTCNSEQSTLWLEQDAKLNALHPGLARPNGGGLTRTEIDFLDAEALSRLEVLYLAGGEPLLHTTFGPVLEKVIQSGNRSCAIEFSTNCTLFPKPKELNNLLSFATVEVYLSIDGLGAENEFLRPPSLWPVTERVVDQWVELARENKNVLLFLSPTVSVYNITRLGRLMDWWFDKLGEPIERGDQRLPVNFCILNSPEYLQVGILPEDIKAKRRSHFAATIESTSNRRLKAKLKDLDSLFDIQAQEQLQRFVDFENGLNGLRGVKLESHPFRELVEPLIARSGFLNSQPTIGIG